MDDAVIISWVKLERQFFTKLNPLLALLALITKLSLSIIWGSGGFLNNGAGYGKANYNLSGGFYIFSYFQSEYR